MQFHNFNFIWYQHLNVKYSNWRQIYSSTTEKKPKLISEEKYLILLVFAWHELSLLMREKAVLLYVICKYQIRVKFVYKKS